MTGQDVVYANLAGNMAAQARSIVDALSKLIVEIATSEDLYVRDSLGVSTL